MVFSAGLPSKATLCLLLIGVLVFGLVTETEAAYRKPPFNGSIFGKRGTEFDNAGKAISAMCEIASEACQSWFPAAENK